MLWVDTGGNYLLCQRLSCPSGTRQLRLCWAGFGIRARLGTRGTLGTPGLGCHPLGAGEELHFSVKSWKFTAIPSCFCSLLQLLGIQQRTREKPELAELCLEDRGGFGEPAAPSPHPMVCLALQDPELNLGAKSMLQHKGVPETPEMLELKVRELSELWMSVLALRTASRSDSRAWAKSSVCRRISGCRSIRV